MDSTTQRTTRRAISLTRTQPAAATESTGTPAATEPTHSSIASHAGPSAIVADSELFQDKGDAAAHGDLSADASISQPSSAIATAQAVHVLTQNLMSLAKLRKDAVKNGITIDRRVVELIDAFKTLNAGGGGPLTLPAFDSAGITEERIVKAFEILTSQLTAHTAAAFDDDDASIVYVINKYIHSDTIWTPMITKCKDERKITVAEMGVPQ